MSYVLWYCGQLRLSLQSLNCLQRLIIILDEIQYNSTHVCYSVHSKKPDKSGTLSLHGSQVETRWFSMKIHLPLGDKSYVSNLGNHTVQSMQMP